MVVWSQRSGFTNEKRFLGLMYYFVPKQAGRPVYSYRLSIIHFWALISLYVGPSPTIYYTALPGWTQSLGMAMSLILFVPSWGGMINGIMTLSGAWHKLRQDAVLRFLVVSLSFYGMSTFEGQVMAIKTVNALSHYTDWTIGHVHSGALGWVAMITIGACIAWFLCWRKKSYVYGESLIHVHFWLMTVEFCFTSLLCGSLASRKARCGARCMKKMAL